MYVNERLRQLLVTRSGTLARGTVLYGAVTLSTEGLAANVLLGSSTGIPRRLEKAIAAWTVRYT